MSDEKASRRAYYDDSYTAEFDGEVVEVIDAGGRPAVLLARTYFYPSSGGQPHDLGELAPESGEAARVVEVLEREEDGAVLHVLDRRIERGAVRGRVDWARRYDHMQQHTAQHILSQAFVAELGAATVSFHLGAETSTIDVDRAGLTPEEAARVEDRANAVVEANGPVDCYEVPLEEVEALGLRKPPVRSGPIRIVDVVGFDRSACGGTHVARTGELGLIKIRRWERRGAETRVEFVAGWRALLDYRWKNETVNRLANALSIRDAELAEAVLRLIEEGRERGRELTALRNRLLDYEAEELWRAAEPEPLAAGGGTARVVARAFAGRSFEEVRHLAGRIAERGGAVALLGLQAGDKGQLAFARSADVALDAGKLLREAIAPFGGRGGGRPEGAQGGVPRADQIEAAVEAARLNLTPRPPLRVGEGEFGAGTASRP